MNHYRTHTQIDTCEAQNDRFFKWSGKTEVEAEKRLGANLISNVDVMF